MSFQTPFLGGNGGGSSGSFDYGSAFGGVGAAIGLGASIFGVSKQYEASKQEAATQQDQIRLEQQVEDQKRQAMELTAKRSSMQDLRQAQVARSMATQNATNQGAQFGAGLQGGLAQVSGQSNTNQLGIMQNLMIGRNMYNLESQISQDKIRMSQEKSEEAEGGAIAGIGGAIGKSIGPLANLGMQLAPLIFR